jgi:hypothetical protein
MDLGRERLRPALIQARHRLDHAGVDLAKRPHLFHVLDGALANLTILVGRRVSSFLAPLVFLAVEFHHEGHQGHEVIERIRWQKRSAMYSPQPAR